MQEFIKDNLGRIIGSVLKIGGNTTLKDSMGRIIGQHNEVTDMVTDAFGKFVGKGIANLYRLLK